MPPATAEKNGAAAATELPQAVVGLSDEAIRELAVSLDWMAKAFPQFDDEAHNLDANAHAHIRTCSTTAYPARKLGQVSAAWSLEVVGEGPKAEAVQSIIRRMPKLPGVIREFVWAISEGVRFGWLTARMDADDGLIIPAITVHKKVKAGGHLEWDGETVVRQQRWDGTGNTPADEVEARKLPRERVVPAP